MRRGIRNCTSKEKAFYCVSLNQHQIVIFLFNRRRCKLTTTGPWIQVTPQVRLRDLSIQSDLLGGSIALWTVGKKGDVLYRHGVAEDCPQVN